MVYYLENEENDVYLLKRAFDKVGCSNCVRWFRSSDELKSAFQNLNGEELPKVVLVDFKLNGELGLDTVAWITTQSQFAHIPTFVLSSGSFESQITASEKVQAAGYLVKPFALEEWIVFAKSVKRLLDSPSRKTVPEIAVTSEPISDARISENFEKPDESDVFDSAFTFSSIGMALVRLDGRWLKVNPALCEILGYSEEELLPIDFQTITHPDDLMADLKYVHEMIAGTRRTYQMEKRYFRKDGQIIWCLLSVSMARNKAGQNLYFISQVQNISDRKKMEEDLKQVNLSLKKSLAEQDELRKGLLTMCAWTKQVKLNEEWVTVEEFLLERFGICTSHGISDEALKTIRKEM